MKRKHERKMFSAKRFWMRRTDEVNGFTIEGHQRFLEGKEETDDITDEDKMYISECKKMKEQLLQCELRTIFQI